MGRQTVIYVLIFASVTKRTVYISMSKQPDCVFIYMCKQTVFIFNDCLHCV